MTIIPRFITRIKPMNGITPFTYRDGLTYLQVLEEIINYIQTTLIGEMNDVIDDLNAQGDDMVIRFNELYGDTKQRIDEMIANNKDRIDDLIGDSEDRIDELEDLINEQITNIVNMQNTLVDYYNVTTSTLDDKFAELDQKIAAIDDRLALIDWLTPGPPTQFVDLGPGDNTVEINPLWEGWPIEYVVRQDANGGRTVTFPDNVTGNIPLKTGPHESTQIRLIPRGDSWVVDSVYTAHYRDTTWKPTNQLEMLDTSNRYCAYVTAASNGNNVVYSYTRSDNHYGGNQSLVIRASSNGGKTFVPGTASPLDPASPQFGISAMAATPWGFVALGVHSDPRRMFFMDSPDGRVWTTRNLISNAFPTEIVWVNDNTENGKLIAVDYRAVGLYLWESTDRGNTWSLGYTFPQMSGDFVAPISEVSIVQLSDDGELLLCTRYDPNVSLTTQHYMFSRSYDYGVSWSPLTIGLRNVTGHPRMAVMPNGDILTPLRCGTQSTKGVNGQWGFAVSKDNGRTWVEHYDGMPIEFQTYGMFVTTPDDKVTLYGAFQKSLSTSHVFRTDVVPTLDRNDSEYDTGWLPLPLLSNMTALTQCSYRRVGKTVFLRGIIDVGNGIQLGPVSIFNTLERWALPEMDITVPVTGEATSEQLAGSALQVLTSGWGQLIRVSGPAQTPTSQYVRLNGVSYPVR